jgi:hypothetical protein
MAFIVAASIPLAAAQAQIPAHTLVSGQTRAAVAQATPGGAWCFVGRGLSTFQGNANGTQATISLPEVTYFDGSAYYLLDGQTRLVFTTATSGNIRFKQIPEYSSTVTYPTFSDYTEVLGNLPNQVVVTFSVSFPSCTLPVYIQYEMQ